MGLNGGVRDAAWASGGSGMSDFRVPFLESDRRPGFEMELDWDETERSWALSEREIGIGTQWVESLPPSSSELKSLLRFFRISVGQAPGNLARLSPGELARVHRSAARRPSVFAKLCGSCSRHWTILRYERGSGGWLAYGRTCEYVWRTGEALGTAEAACLKDVLSGQARSARPRVSKPPDAKNSA
jgi:hypothetical protein